jgi:CheY-like chemotaxis protein
VAESPNGRVALEQIAADRPALILLDLMMPGMNGFEFIAELRQRETGLGIPVVVLTAKDLTSEEHQRLTGCVERVLQKGGVSREQLLNEMEALRSVADAPR